MGGVARIGVISDTHGAIHPAITSLFANVDAIVHAGDIGGAHVLAVLRAMAPLTAVGGNNDAGTTGEDIVRVKLGTLRVLLTHILPRPHRVDARVKESLREEPADVVVFGHSHMPHNEVIDGVRYFNPASAGPRRFDLPIAAGIFERKGREWNAMHVALDERSVEALKKWMNGLSRGGR